MTKLLAWLEVVPTCVVGRFLFSSALQSADAFYIHGTKSHVPCDIPLRASNRPEVMLKLLSVLGLCKDDLEMARTLCDNLYLHTRSAYF